MKKLPPTNVCRARPFLGAPSTGGNGCVFLDDRHVAGLAAALFGGECTVLPFLERHLFRQLADHLSFGTERLRHERVTRRADFGLPYVRGFRRLEARRRPHDGRHPALDLEGAEHRPLLARPCATRAGIGGGDDVASGEAGCRAEILIGNLMAHGARDAVVGETIGPTAFASDGQVIEDASLRTVDTRLCSRHRHVARRATVLNRLCRRGVIGHFPPHAGLPVRIARRIGHHRRPPARADRHVFSRRRAQAVVARHALIRGRENFRMRIALTTHRGHRDHGGYGDETKEARYHPEKNPPSNQSHSR